VKGDNNEMTKEFVRLAAGVAVAVGSLAAQGVVIEGSGFQQANVMGRSGGVLMPAQSDGRGASRLVTGKPVSATEERKTAQTLADGTQLENSDTNLFYRDSQGRTRVETTTQGNTIRISDPIAHTTVVLNPETKTAFKSNVIAIAARLSPPLPQPGPQQATGGVQPRGTTQSGGAIQPTIAGGGGGGRGGFGGSAESAYAAGAVQRIPRAGIITTEELGAQTVNGVPAQGVRDTQVIPAGRIGNNRDIRVVNERWFSNELQMLVKSVNTDPRFGTTTYQLTNIVQGEPASALFQIPADYTLVEPGK
jgi:hypothetical protein